MQVAASAIVLGIGLTLALVIEAPADMRLFGWILVVVGAFGLVLHWVLVRLRDDRNPPGPGR